MGFIDRVTGRDIDRGYKAIEERASALPQDYRQAWQEIRMNLWPHADMTGRNLLPIFSNVMDLFEETAAEGQSVSEVLGDDIEGFCTALCGDEGAKTYRDKWREQLNRNVARKLAALTDREV